jgi:hypothetical protein
VHMMSEVTRVRSRERAGVAGREPDERGT